MVRRLFLAIQSGFPYIGFIMKIEDKIRQVKFRNEHHRLLANLSYNYSWIQSETQKILKSFGISFQQFNILSILRGQSPNTATLNLIKERLLDPSSDVSRLVERLVKKGLIDRDICPKDRRQVDITINPKGLALLAQLDKESKRVDNLVSNLSLSEAKKLNALLDKIKK
jgi:DNA-binding MarR family transcriptional regulator